MLDLISDMPLIAVFRAPTAERFLPASEVLVKAGFRCLEFTMTTQGVLDAVREARAKLPESVRVGVGTVRSAAMATASAEAGAQFLVSQVHNDDVVRAADALGLPFIPGALTPNEIVRAWASGVPAVKVSPIGPVGGPRYLREIKGPMPEIPLMPTGGVAIDEVDAYLAAGAAAVGLSALLFEDVLAGDGSLDGLAQRARRAVQKVREHLG